jgi:hypothetical protein
MIADIVAYFFIMLAIIVAGGLLLLFITLVVLDGGWKKAQPLLWMAVLVGGFVWALFRLGVM